MCSVDDSIYYKARESVTGHKNVPYFCIKYLQVVIPQKFPTNIEKALLWMLQYLQHVNRILQVNFQVCATFLHNRTQKFKKLQKAHFRPKKLDFSGIQSCLRALKPISVSTNVAIPVPQVPYFIQSRKMCSLDDF